MTVVEGQIPTLLELLQTATVRSELTIQAPSQPDLKAIDQRRLSSSVSGKTDLDKATGRPVGTLRSKSQGPATRAKSHSSSSTAWADASRNFSNPGNIVQARTSSERPADLSDVAKHLPANFRIPFEPRQTRASSVGNAPEVAFPIVKGCGPRTPGPRSPAESDLCGTVQTNSR